MIKNEPFNTEEIYEILKQLNNSFRIMVNNKILHGVYIVKLKLTDYSCSLNDASNLISSIIENNNLKICSPEILMKEKDIEKCDLWSIGILIYLLYFKEFPFTGNDENELLDNIKSIIEEGKLKKIDNVLLDDLI